MANFFFTGGSGGEQAINLDQVRLVNHETVSGRVTIYFQPEYTVILEGEVAKQFMDVLGGLRSEAKALTSGAVKRSGITEPTAKKPRPPFEVRRTLNRVMP